MNKWIETYMEEHDLKPNERFEIDQQGEDSKYFFREDGMLVRDVGTNYECVSYHTLGKIMDGIRIEKVKPKGRYIPKEGEFFWYVTTYGYILVDRFISEQNIYTIEHNLVFRTEEEAEDYKWFLDQVYNYKKEFVKDKYNYCFYFDVDYKRLEIDYNQQFKYDLTYFGNGENIEEFRNVVGEERIKKYMFDVWE